LVRLFRKAGIKVSGGETRDFMEALTHTGVDREGFAWALEAALVKENEKWEIARRILDLYLQDAAAKNTGAQKLCPPVNDAPKLDPEEFLARLNSLKNFIRNEKMLMRERTAGSPEGGARGLTAGKRRPESYGPQKTAGESFVSMILTGSADHMLLTARNAAEGLKGEQCHERDFLKRLKALSGWAEGEAMLERMAAAGHGPDSWTVEDRVKEFARLVDAERDRVLWKSDPGAMLDRHDVNGLPFNSLDYDEAREIKRKLFLMARSLATRKGYRYRAAKRGAVDLGRTASLAGLYGGIPLKLLKRDRIPTRHEILILCDLSGSVASFSRFMMLLVSAMHERFRSVRTFAFVENIEEVTGMIRGWDAQRKIARILRETGIWQTGFSDYGAVWKVFGEKYGHLVNKKTNLIILGDAKNNYKSDGLDHFIGIAARARRVFWLNPAPAQDWDREDSIISRYSPYCHSVTECRNLKHLEKAARNVFN
jgi:uncharacterized protein with von Willebrand factor type A (vWA) domain